MALSPLMPILRIIIPNPAQSYEINQIVTFFLIALKPQGRREQCVQMQAALLSSNFRMRKMYKDRVNFLRSLKYRSIMSQHIAFDHAHQLSELVKHAISTSSLIANQNVQYKIEQEQVFLTGIVSSYYVKQLAQESVSRVDGVRQVHNRLTVEPTQNEAEPLSSH